MKFKKRYLLAFPILLGAAALLGPRVHFEPITLEKDDFDLPIEELDQFLAEREAKVVNLKPENESRIIWADGQQKTEYSIVYLHGYSASPMEGHPVHEQLAKRYGCNLYLPRLDGHGIDDEESFLNLTPDGLMDDAKEALDIGHLIGEKVILMSCSTGGTLSNYLAAKLPERVHAQIMYSPNFAIYDSNAKFLTGPWGDQIARKVGGGNYRSFVPPPGGEKYWTTKYRIEGVLALQKLLDWSTTPEIFKAIKQPYFLGYYYKSEEVSDHIVSIPAMLDYHEITSTPDKMKRCIPFPDVGNHVMISDIQADDYTDVVAKTEKFMEEVLKMGVRKIEKPVDGMIGDSNSGK